MLIVKFTELNMVSCEQIRFVIKLLKKCCSFRKTVLAFRKLSRFPETLSRFKENFLVFEKSENFKALFCILFETNFLFIVIEDNMIQFLKYEFIFAGREYDRADF